MLILPTNSRTHRRRQRGFSTPPTPPPTGAPVLVAATFDTSDGAVLTLTFDRAVQLVGYDGSRVNVFDHPNLARFDGGAGAMLLGPAAVRIECSLVSAVPPGDEVTLDVGAASGIVAAAGGEAWAGVSFVELPYP